MENKESIKLETTCYIERPSKNLIESILIKVSDSYKHNIECIEVTQKNANDMKLILTLQNHQTEDKEFVTIPFSLFSLFIKNKPTNDNEGVLL